MESAQVKEFVCCYHGWTYGLDGKLMKATKMKDIKDFKNKDFGLHEIPCTQWGPFVFLHFGPSGTNEKRPKEAASMTVQGLPDLHKQLAPLHDQLTKHFEDIGKMKYVGSKVFPLNCNWKIYVDNYLDGEFHIPLVHPGLNSALSMSTYETQCYENFSIQFSFAAQKGKTAKDVQLGEDFDERLGKVAVYAMLYPNFAINRYGDMMDSNYIHPVAHDKCEVHYDFFFEEKRAKDTDYVGKSIAASSKVQEEDGNICENLQKGLSSLGYDKGRYAPTVEKGTYHFHKLLAAHLFD